MGDVVLVNADDFGLWFRVSSSSRCGEGHEVFFDWDCGWLCTCEHHFFRKVECKHIRSCKEWLFSDKGFSVVGVSAYGVLVYSDDVVECVVGMGCYYDLIKGE